MAIEPREFRYGSLLLSRSFLDLKKIFLAPFCPFPAYGEEDGLGGTDLELIGPSGAILEGPFNPEVDFRGICLA